MKNVCIIVAVLLGLVFASCSSSHQETRSDHLSGDEFGGISHGVIDPDPLESNFTLNYDGGNVELTYMLENADTYNEWGLSIYVSGYRQLFSVNGNAPEYTFISSYEPNEKKTIKVSFSPIYGFAGDVLPISFVVMLKPTYVQENAEAQRGYGGIHSITQMPWQLKMNKGVSPPESPVSYDLKEMLDESFVARYSIAMDDNTSICLLDSSVYFEVVDEYLSPDCYMQMPGKALNLHIRAAGCNPIHGIDTVYRVSVYVDHEIVACFNGKEYADISVSRNYISQIELSLPWSIMKDKHHLYIMAVPIMKPDLSKGLLPVLKTETKSIKLHEGETK